MNIRKQIEDNPKHQGFYAEIGKGACRMANSFAPLRDAAVALEILSEDLLNPNQADTAITKREAGALLHMVYDLSHRAEELCAQWEQVDGAARSAGPSA